MTTFSTLPDSLPAAEPAAPTRRSWLKRLGAVLGAGLLARPALANATRSPLQVQETDPYLGEIMLCVYGFVPRGFMACDGQMMAIASNQALFSLLGTAFGGNGTTTFALPDLRGRVPRGSGSGYQVGQTGGSETTTLALNSMTTHRHGAQASSAAASIASPLGAVPAVPTAANLNGEAVDVLAYGAVATTAATTTTNAGSGVPFNNQAPYNTIQYCIAVQGIYPSRS